MRRPHSLRHHVLSMALVILLVGCGGGDSPSRAPSPTQDSESNGRLSLTGLAVSDQMTDGFTVTATFSGDTNTNATVTLHYCNDTDLSACNPMRGETQVMSRGGSTFQAIVSGLSSPDDPGDRFTLAVTAEDIDGVTGLPLNESVQLQEVVMFPDNALILGDIGFSQGSATGFSVNIPYSGDANQNAIATFYMCNATDMPGCLPANGSTTVMQRSGSEFVATISGLGPPDEPGDTLNVSVVATDVDDVTGSPRSASTQLLQSAVVSETVHGFIGGSQYERVQGTFVDDNGFIYLVGTTHSDDFPATAGSFQSTKPSPPGVSLENSDGYVVKLSADGTRIIWATYLGGSRRESAYGVRVDSSGNVYVCGATGSPDFPTTADAYDRSFNGPTGFNYLSDVFVAKFNSNGQLLFSTFVGGDSGAPGPEENPRGAIHIDEERGRIYVAGVTGANNFPTTVGAYQPAFAGGASDAFVFALSIDGTDLLKATFLGGSGADAAPSNIVQHSDGSIYVGGGTSSRDFPVTAGAFQTSLMSGTPSQSWTIDGDAFVVRLSVDLDRLIFATYLGGNNQDAVAHNQGLSIDSQNRPVVYLNVLSDDFPVTAAAHDTTYGGNADVAVVILSEDGANLVSSTYVGGSAFDYASGVSVGADDRVYISGGTQSRDFAVSPDAFQADYAGGEDAFFVVLSPDLTQASYSTYIGGGNDEMARGLWVNAANKIIVGGYTNSADFPTQASHFQRSLGGAKDGFIFGFDLLNQ